MELILAQEVRGLGKAGERIKVKDGYARNFLIPNRLALELTPQNLAYSQQIEKKKQTQAARGRQSAEELSKRISEVICAIAVSVGEQDRLFGAVTAQMIVAALKEKNNISLEKRTIELEEPIKKLGSFTIPIRLHPEVKTQLKVSVVRKD